MIVYKIPNKLPPFLDEIDGSLGSLQAFVQGYIEPCAPAELKEWNIELLANEEGLLTGFDPNENLFPFFLVGNVIAVGVRGEDFASLSAYQVCKLVDWLEGLKKL